MDKPGIIFIHGLNKNKDNWNITEFNKTIDIEKRLSKNAHTILIQIDDFNDTDVSIIVDQMNMFKVRSWTVVCHSLGVVYGLQLLKHNVTRLCLIDPTPLDDVYINELTNRKWDQLIKYCKLEYNFSTKVIFHIHLNYPTEDFDRTVKYYKKFIGKNDKSKLFIHPNKGHMIHYTDSQKIINSISDLIMY